jgi:hypothetical protein
MQYSKYPFTSSSVSLSSENFSESGFQAHVSYLLPSVIFGGLVVIVLAIGSKVRGFKPSRGRWNFKGNKISSKNSFEEEVKPLVPCRKFLRHVKEHSGV